MPSGRTQYAYPREWANDLGSSLGISSAEDLVLEALRTEPYCNYPGPIRGLQIDFRQLSIPPSTREPRNLHIVMLTQIAQIPVQVLYPLLVRLDAFPLQSFVQL